MGFFSSSGKEGGTGWGERETVGEKKKKKKDRERAEKSKAMSNLVEPEAGERPWQSQQLTG